MSYKKSLGTKEMSVEIGPLASAALPSPPPSISPSQRAEAEREFQLGERSYWCFDDGEDLESLEDAVKHYQRSRELGHAGALGVLGKITINGVGGIESDEKGGFAMIEESVEQGHVAGKRALASCYYFGSGGQKENHDKAFEAYTSAAEQSYPPAVEALGVCYLYGHGVEKNQTKALELLLKASELGMPQFDKSLLAQCYANGEGVKKDKAKADAWNAKAEKQWRRRVKARADWVLEPFDPVQSANFCATQGYIGTLPEDIWTALVVATLFYTKSYSLFLGGITCATVFVQAALICFICYDFYTGIMEYAAVQVENAGQVTTTACSCVAFTVLMVALLPEVKNTRTLSKWLQQLQKLPSDPLLQVEGTSIRIERLYEPTAGVEGVALVATNVKPQNLYFVKFMALKVRPVLSSVLAAAALYSLVFRTPDTIGEIVLNTIGFVFISEIDDLAYNVWASPSVKHFIQTLVWYDRSVCDKNILQSKPMEFVSKQYIRRITPPVILIYLIFVSLAMLFTTQNTNIASGYESFVGGGLENTASGLQSFVGSGFNNTASGDGSTVGGGQHNTASEESSFVGAGDGNTASGNWSTVSGGYQNTASSVESVVGGGYNNTAYGNWSTVSGGFQNTAELNSTVGGGDRNVASGFSSIVGGGQQNIASGSFAAVSGGSSNVASGTASVASGFANIAGGNYSLAVGFNATTSSDHSAVLGFQATGACPSNGPNTVTVCAPNGFFVNGVELGAGRRLLSEDVADAGVDAAHQKIAALQLENAALKREIDTLKREMANIVRLVSQSGSRALVTP